jgi:hypothetical protein
MIMHAGIDRSDYPGDQIMKDLWDYTNLAWTGYYLAPAPAHSDGSWMGTYTTLRKMGYGFAPLYLGQQTQGPGKNVKKVNGKQGAIDAKDAVALTRGEGFPQKSVIYLDFEQWDRIDSGGHLNTKTKDYLSPESKEYYKTWVQGVFDGGYYPGVYCFPKIAAENAVVDRRPVVWVVAVTYPKITYKNTIPTPPICKDDACAGSLVQFAQGCNLQYKHFKKPVGKNAKGQGGKFVTRTLLNVDLDSSDSPDPSNFLNFTNIP